MQLSRLLAASAITASAAAADDLIIADFEGDQYAPWTVSGEAFGAAPAKGPLPGQMNVEGFRGKGLVNSFNKGDDSIGSLTSPGFRIERKYRKPVSNRVCSCLRSRRNVAA
jgi:fructan beta-fructosidase